MSHEIDKQDKFFTVRNLSDDDMQISEIFENTANQETTTGREVLITANTFDDIKEAVYSVYVVDANGDVIEMVGRPLAEVKTYPNVDVEDHD